MEIREKVDLFFVVFAMIALATVISLMVWYFYIKDDRTTSAPNVIANVITVEIGQIWVMESDDPFNPENREYMILDTLSGWVKYCKTKYANRPDRDEFAMTAKKETITSVMRLKSNR